MRSVAFWFFAAIAAAFVCLPAAADIPPPAREPKEGLPQPLPTEEVKDGWYRLSGKAGDKIYSGMVLVQHVQGDTYLMRWIVPGTPNATGMGIRHGDGGDRITVSWFSETNGKVSPGLSNFRVSRGKLEGTWRALPANQGQETLRWAFPLGDDDE